MLCTTSIAIIIDLCKHKRLANLKPATSHRHCVVLFFAGGGLVVPMEVYLLTVVDHLLKAGLLHRTDEALSSVDCVPHYLGCHLGSTRHILLYMLQHPFC